MPIKQNRATDTPDFRSEFIDELLREHYARLARLPLPDRMVKLLDNLELKEKLDRADPRPARRGH